MFEALKAAVEDKLARARVQTLLAGSAGVYGFVLRQCERDLKVLERHRGDFPYDPDDGPGDYSWTEHCMACHAPTPCPDVRDLAEVYQINLGETA